jgi:hypothetical protein
MEDVTVTLNSTHVNDEHRPLKVFEYQMERIGAKYVCGPF